MEEKLKKLQNMRREMFWIKLLVYFLRNNPRYTKRYYYKLIEIVGTENYLCSPLVRNEWDSAKNSFDKLYGLVSTWRNDFTIFDCEKTKTDDGWRECFDNFILKQTGWLRGQCSSLEKELFRHIKDDDENEAKRRFDDFLELNKSLLEIEIGLKERKSESETFSDKTKKAEEVIGIYKQLTEIAVAEKDFFKKELEEKTSKKEEKSPEEKEKKDGVSENI